MVITGIETFLVRPRWMFVKVSTDSGIEGWGECGLEGFGEVVRECVATFASRLIDTDPLRIEDHWQHLSRGGFYRGGAVISSAVAGVDQALWDIAGKTYGVPVHQLLGGPVRDRIRVYGWVGGDDPDGIAAAVQAQVDAGLTAVKMNASGRMGHIGTAGDTAAVLDRANAARDTLGPDRDFAMDFHGRISAPMARRLLTRLEPLHPLFVEEPVRPGVDEGALARLIAGTSIPIATGERLFSRSDVLPALRDGIAVLQPDVAHAGGISEVRRIASLAETFDAAIAPHCPLGPLALAACLQVDFAAPNVLIQEQSLGIHYNQGGELLDYVSNPEIFAIVDGYMQRPTGVGLGVQIDEDAVRRSDREPHAWRNTTWRHPDGSLAEW